MKKDLSTPKLISNRSINYNEIYNYVESIFKELTKDIKTNSFLVIKSHKYTRKMFDRTLEDVKKIYKIK